MKDAKPPKRVDTDIQDPVHRRRLDCFNQARMALPGSSIENLILEAQKIDAWVIRDEQNKS